MATRTFRGTIDADWNTAGNWLELAVPTTADDVVFDAASPACTASGAMNMLTLDCTGFAATIAPGANTVTIAGTVFKLVAGCWTTGTCLVDFTATAGTCAVTFAGNTLYNVRTGNGGAGGTFQQQDAGLVTLSLDIVRGTWQTNNQTLSVGQDLLLKSTALTGAFVAGSATISVGRSVIASVDKAITEGTSTFVMTGTGSVRLDTVVPGKELDFFNLNVAPAGGVTTMQCTVNTTYIHIKNVLTIGAGTLLQSMVSPSYFDINGSAVSNSLVVDPAATITADIACYPVGGSPVQNIPALNMTGTLKYKAATTLTGNVAVTGNVNFYGRGGTDVFDSNGFNLTCSGNLLIGLTGSYCVQFILRAASVFTVGGNFTYWTQNDVNCLNQLIFGQLLVTGNFLCTNIPASSVNNPTFNIYTGGVIQIRGNIDLSSTNRFWGDRGGKVRFVAPGAFTITASPAEVWPIVEITAGGIVTLPNNFNCYDLVATNATITQNTPATIRHAYTLGAASTFTSSAELRIGSSFVAAGGATLALTGNLVAQDGLVTLTGIAACATLTMSASCIRLQLTNAMLITALVIAPRTVPGVIQLLAGGAYTITTLNSQIGSNDGPVQLISSAAGTSVTLTITNITSAAYLWPRDMTFAGAAQAKTLTIKSLGNNAGTWLFSGDGQLRFVTDDPGLDELAAVDIGSIQYCWLVATSQAALIVLATAFAAGANNWHRRSNVPFAVLDNLDIGTGYFVGLGLRDDRDRRAAPNVAGGDFSEAIAYRGSAGGGGSVKIVATTQFAF